MDSTTSYISISLFIAFGILVIVSLFIFGKRQITRFTIKSSRRPHVPIGHSAPEELRNRINTRLEKINKISFEPKLINDKCEVMPESVREQGIKCYYKYRMLALDAISALDENINLYEDVTLRRLGLCKIRPYLTYLHDAGPLSNASSTVLNRFANLYNHARHMAEIFGQKQYESYINVLEQVLSEIIKDFNDKCVANVSKVETQVHLSDSISQTTVVSCPTIRSDENWKTDKPPEYKRLVESSHLSDNSNKESMYEKRFS